MKFIKPNCELCAHCKVCSYAEEMRENTDWCEDEDDPFEVTVKCAAFVYDREAAKKALCPGTEAAKKNDWLPSIIESAICYHRYNPYAKCVFTFDSVYAKSAFFEFIKGMLDKYGRISVSDLCTFNDEWFDGHGEPTAALYGWTSMPINEAPFGDYNKVIFSNPKRLD